MGAAIRMTTTMIRRRKISTPQICRGPLGASRLYLATLHADSISLRLANAGIGAIVGKVGDSEGFVNQVNRLLAPAKNILWYSRLDIGQLSQ